MIHTKFDDLIRKKEYEDKRNLPLRTIAAETGLAIGTVQRLRKGDTSRIYLDTLDKLCWYFGVSDIGDVLAYTPDADRPAPPTEPTPPQEAAE